MKLQELKQQVRDLGIEHLVTGDKRRKSSWQDAVIAWENGYCDDEAEELKGELAEVKEVTSSGEANNSFLVWKSGVEQQVLTTDSVPAKQLSDRLTLREVQYDGA